MKRIFAIFLSAILILGMLCGCSKEETYSDEAVTDNDVNATLEAEKLVVGYWKLQFSLSNETSEIVNLSEGIVGLTFFSDGTGNILMSPYDLIDFEWEHYETHESGSVYSIYANGTEMAVGIFNDEEYGNILMTSGNKYTSYYVKS